LHALILFLESHISHTVKSILMKRDGENFRKYDITVGINFLFIYFKIYVFVIKRVQITL